MITWSYYSQNFERDSDDPVINEWLIDQDRDFASINIKRNVQSLGNSLIETHHRNEVELD